MPTARPTRLAIATVGVALSLALAPVPHAGEGHGDLPHDHLGEVPGGHLTELGGDVPAVFWQTPFVACDRPPSTTSPSAPKGCDGGALIWTFDVGAAADLLRVDLDQPYRQDGFALTVISPTGQRSSAGTGGADYAAGVRVRDPAAGRWTVELQPLRTNGTRVRLRAGLLDEERVRGNHQLLPNLQVTPPFEFGFAAPANPTNSVFLAGDDVNPPMTVAGVTTNSCTADEVQEAADPTRTAAPTVLLRCLRFTAGPKNAGPGHFDLRFPIVDRAREDRDRLVEMTQVIHHANPALRTERPAGTYEYHATHGHWHYLDVLHYQAFTVVDAATGELEPLGIGRKSGFCPVDQGYAVWTSFDQVERDTLVREQDSGGCFAIGGNGSMGLSAGWGDFYRWQRPGQYVDFTGAGDGTYVVRTTVDPLDNVLETDETDNSSYALIRVTGDQVEVLERGQGDSPWDPDRVLAEDNRT